jgi:hypothetical protein
MAEYQDAFDRPNASKGYETKPSTKQLLANVAKTEAAALAAEEKFIAAVDFAETLKYQDAFARPNAANGYEEPKKKEVFLTAVPATPPSVTVLPPKPTVKTAPIDTVLFNDDSVPIEVMTDLIFENIGGHELINIARNDIVNGQQVSYQPIKNLSSIQQQYNPNNILGIQNTSDKYFSNFSIKFENKVPETGSGPNGSNVYLDTATGNLVIETINMDNDEQVEIEITLGGIIYEAEFGEINS